MSEPCDPVNQGANVVCVFAAHAAARAMARRGARLMPRPSLLRVALLASAACGRRPAWTPLLLRWARNAVAVRSGGTVRAPALAARPGGVFHWHLHLALLSGSDRAPRAARAAALAAPLRTRAQTFPMNRTRAQAFPMNRPGAARMADSGYRRLGGPTSSGEGAGTMRPSPPPASIDRARFAAHAHRERASTTFHWLGRTAAHARDVGGDPDSRSAQLPYLPKGQPPRIGGSLRAGAPALGQARAARPSAVWGKRLASPLMAPRSAIGAPAAMISSRRSPKDFLQRTHSQETRTLLWEKRATPATRAFDSARAPAARRPHGEQVWRASDTAAAAINPARHVAPPRTVAGIAVRRPLDLVWPAGPAGAAPAGQAQRLVNAGEANLLSARSTQAATQAPAAVGPPRASTVIRADALDPALANRLADEVMRRIDHRARIERERRGL